MFLTIDIFLLLIAALIKFVQTSYDPFVDNIPFNIVWSGPGNPQTLPGLVADDDGLVIMSSNHEKYKCVIPQLNDNNQKDDIESYAGPSEMELLSPLFEQTSCSYRIESYWTYELCHGKSLRQYHEEKDVQHKTKLQEYFLGIYSPESSATEGEDEPTSPAESEPLSERAKHAPTKKVEGLEIPYFEVRFTDGTPCDLTGEPRHAAVQYVCQPEGSGEIYELKETVTCGYEVVVLTSQLCTHPLYRLKSSPVNDIVCHSLEGAPHKPLSLTQLEGDDHKPAERSKKQPQKDADTASSSSSSPQNMPSKVQITYKPAREKQGEASSTVTSTLSSASGQQVLDNFLRGDYCIQGGAGWWKHEFCFGKHVSQYHKDKTSKVTISLGTWDAENHMEWLTKNPKKRPREKLEDRKHIIHFYSNGDICDLTGNHRETEVKIKCVQSPSQPTAISIYLVEPSACIYLLVVESQLFCDILSDADQYGILP